MCRPGDDGPLRSKGRHLLARDPPTLAPRHRAEPAHRCSVARYHVHLHAVIAVPPRPDGDHLGEFDARHLLAPAADGHDIGLVSEAGMPAVADPGSSVVRAAHDLGLTVVPLVGPVSLLLALAASGLNGQNFAFVGYLPQDPDARARRIRELESLCLKQGQTQLFIETPYRNTALVQSLLQTLAPTTRLAVSSGLTLPSAFSRGATVADWRKQRWAPDNSTPAVFAIGR